MILRSWLILLALCVLLPPSTAAAATAGPAHGVGVERDGPSIESDRDPLSRDLRISEGPAPLAAVGRILVNCADAMLALVQRGAEASGARESLADGWCDVVQCRRQSGTQVLRYATPPPARG